MQLVLCQQGLWALLHFGMYLSHKQVQIGLFGGIKFRARPGLHPHQLQQHGVEQEYTSSRIPIF